MKELCIVPRHDQTNTIGRIPFKVSASDYPTELKVIINSFPTEYTVKARYIKEDEKRWPFQENDCELEIGEDTGRIYKMSMSKFFPHMSAHHFLQKSSNVIDNSEERATFLHLYDSFYNLLSTVAENEGQTITREQPEVAPV